MQDEMKIFNIVLIISTLALCTVGCDTIPAHSQVSGYRIVVGPGPEDMVLDEVNSPRLLISCSSRRSAYEPYGEIESLDLRTMDRSVLIRYNEPDSLVFRPHGIYLDGEMLYVISHEIEPDYHPILIYRVRADSLKFTELIHSSLQHSPNALVCGPGGDIYFVNDSGKRGSLIEKILKLKRASVVRLRKDADGSWDAKIMAYKLGYPAGINRIGDKLYAGDAIQHVIHTYKIGEMGLTPGPDLGKLKGNDNLRIYEGKILTSGHVKPFRFIKHAKESTKLSPVEVSLANPLTGETTSIFSTDGSQISGGSTAIIYEDMLYICQVFEPFILKVKLNLGPIP